VIVATDDYGFSLDHASDRLSRKVVTSPAMSGETNALTPLAVAEQLRDRAGGLDRIIGDDRVLASTQGKSAS